MITILHRGGYAQMITILHGGGSLGTPKSDYVICARPLIKKQKKSIFRDRRPLAGGKSNLQLLNLIKFT